MIKYSKNTIGCNVGGVIFLHPELHKYPKLYKAVLAHEKKHTNSFRKEDVLLDLINDDLKGNKKEFYKFMFTHPRTMLGFLPLTKIGKHWCLDLELLVVWASAILMAIFVGTNIWN